MAIIIKQPKPLTDEDLLELSRLNPGYQFERDARGELIVTPTGIEGGRRSLELGRQLGNWTIRNGTGVAFDSSTGFRLPDGALFAPDAAWVRRSQLDALTPDQRKKFGPLCPDAAFEIRSESNTVTELRDKIRAYLANGTRLGVLIDPDSRTAEVYRPGQEPQVFTDPKILVLDPELPGFALELAPIFEP
jgi:Uma2 family endonuclease